jgi:two-component system, response regulator PdtaR
MPPMPSFVSRRCHMARAQILIAEDEGIVALDMKNRLVRRGYAVTGIAATGEDVLRAVESSPPDLVLMDIRLRGPTDGVELAQEIYRRFNIPVIYVTALTDEETLKRARATAYYGYLTKPFGDAEMENTIQSVLSQRENG